MGRTFNDTFEINVLDETYVIDIAELMLDLRIDPVDVGEDLRNQPGSFAWVAVLAAQADYEAGRAKQSLAALRAVIGKELHAENEGKGRADRMTEAAVDECVTTDEHVLEMAEEYMELARRAAILTGLREAFRHRKDMLNALAYGSRQSQKAEE
ncbi:hypothetical protein LCGC14_0446540 [marine sediment metagenome]|uniref:Uncharacterized protein n=1 Tax=marine sediment metagenome TaxID=412755 RepID=A0A0F9SPX8_9ZZZZ